MNVYKVKFNNYESFNKNPNFKLLSNFIRLH